MDTLEEAITDAAPFRGRCVAFCREPADILTQSRVPVLLEGSVRDVYSRDGYLQAATISVAVL